MPVYKTKNPTKDGRQYFFRIKYKDEFNVFHDHKSILFKNKKDAENEEALFRIKVNNKTAYVSKITFKEIFAEYVKYKSTKLKIQSLEKVKTQIKNFDIIQDIRINDFGIDNYNKLLKQFKNRELSINYINKLFGLLKSIITYSNKYYNTSVSGLKYIENIRNTERKKEMDFFTIEEYKQFDSVIDDHIWHTFFATLYFMGIRQGECQALTWNDIDFENKTLNINKTLTTKIKGEKYTISSPKTKNSIRILPIPQNLLDDLKSIKNNVQKYKDYSNKWFVFGNSLPFPETTIQKRKNSYCKLANIKQIRIHDFRHSCASLLINKGASIPLVSKYLGHSNISVTLNTYTHLYKNELREISNIINKI